MVTGVTGELFNSRLKLPLRILSARIFQNLDCGAGYVCAGAGRDSAVYAAILRACRDQRLGAVHPFAFGNAVFLAPGFQGRGTHASLLVAFRHRYGFLVFLPAHVDLF